MTILSVMTSVCKGIIARNGQDKAELNSEDVRSIQQRIQDSVGLMVDDRDVKIFYKAFAAEYWKTHTKKPSMRKEGRSLFYAG